MPSSVNKVPPVIEEPAPNAPPPGITLDVKEPPLGRPEHRGPAPMFARPNRPTWPELRQAIADKNADKKIIRDALKHFRTVLKEAVRCHDEPSEAIMDEAIAACEAELDGA